MLEMTHSVQTVMGSSVYLLAHTTIDVWLCITCSPQSHRHLRQALLNLRRYCLPSDLATISYSLAYLRAKPSPDGLQLLAANLARVWPKLTGDELANCAMSLALWQYRPSDRWGSKQAQARSSIT